MKKKLPRSALVLILALGILLGIALHSWVICQKPQNLEEVLGPGFSRETITEIGVHIGGDPAFPFRAGDENFHRLMDLLEAPTYTRTQPLSVLGIYSAGFTYNQELSHPFWLVFFGKDERVRVMDLYGGDMVHLDNKKHYKISGGNQIQEEIMDFLLEQAKVVSPG